MTAEEVRAKFPVGARVKRGPDWEFHNQDCDENGVQTIGTTTDRHPTDYGGIGWWIEVKWEGGDTNIYRVTDKKHIVLVSGEIINNNPSAPRNNDGRAVCFWCPNTNTQKRGGGVYDICPKCGK